MKASDTIETRLGAYKLSFQPVRAEIRQITCGKRTLFIALDEKSRCGKVFDTDEQAANHLARRSRARVRRTNLSEALVIERVICTGYKGQAAG